jgi:hypothetical protein
VNYKPCFPKKKVKGIIVLDIFKKWIRHATGEQGGGAKHCVQFGCKKRCYCRLSCGKSIQALTLILRGARSLWIAALRNATTIIRWDFKIT